MLSFYRYTGRGFFWSIIFHWPAILLFYFILTSSILAFYNSDYTSLFWPIFVQTLNYFGMFDFLNKLSHHFIKFSNKIPFVLSIEAMCMSFTGEYHLINKESANSAFVI